MQKVERSFFGDDKPEMAQHLSPENFDHRLYEDGMIDTICLRCFSTVASMRSEAQLRTAEIDHDCAMCRAIQPVSPARFCVAHRFF
jgi:hypothetical protein